MSEARIDKWMWAVRIFKTRTIAAEACKKGRISINGGLAKAARTVKPGDIIRAQTTCDLLFQSIASYRETYWCKARYGNDGERYDSRSV